MPLYCVNSWIHRSQDIFGGQWSPQVAVFVSRKACERISLLLVIELSVEMQGWSIGGAKK